MKAIVYSQYGPPDVLHLTDVAKPAPQAHEILVRIRATTAAAGDWRLRKADPFAARLYNGLLRPRKVTILGLELAGDVEAIGQAVTRFQPGDPVFAFTGFGFGGYAEYICLPQQNPKAVQGLVARMPANLSYAEAAAVPVGGLTAQAFLRQAGLRRGQTALIYGASGSVGTYAVQIARHYGADVTGVCGAANLELAKSLGAGRVLDYTRDDFDLDEQAYDVIFDAVGKLGKAQARRALRPGGSFQTVRGSAPLEQQDLDCLKQLIEAGHLRAVIDRRYPLAQAADAHRHIEAGHKRGNVVLTVGSGVG